MEACYQSAGKLEGTTGVKLEEGAQVDHTVSPVKTVGHRGRGGADRHAVHVKDPFTCAHTHFKPGQRESIRLQGFLVV